MTTTAEWRLGGRTATFSFYLTTHVCKTTRTRLAMVSLFGLVVRTLHQGVGED